MGDNVGNQLPISAKKKQFTLQFSNGADDLDGYSNLYARTDPTQGKGCISATCYFGDGGTLSNVGSGSGTVNTGTAPRIAFYSDTDEVSSSIVANITTSNIAAIDGTAAAPPFTFKSDPNTGVFSVASDQVGFSAGGTLQANVSSAGLTVGVVGTVGSSIRRLAATYANSWEDGHMGNSNQLVFTPSDFYNGSQTTSRAPSVESSQGNPAVRNSKWYGIVDGDGIICAQKIIPKGFAIDRESSIIINTGGGVNLTNTTVYVSGQRISQAAIPLTTLNILSVDDYTTNSLVQANGLGTITGDGTTMVTLYFDAGVALTTTNSVSGALITMKRV